MKKVFNLPRTIILTAIVILFFPFVTCIAEEGKVALTISPPLIKQNMSPGEKWSSTIKLVNNNKETITVYMQSADFKSSEEGTVEFIPTGQKDNYKFALSQWLEFSQEPIEIEPQGSREIPFTINVPSDAEPGGHYAAMLAGTKPQEDIYGSGMKVSSILASLIMLEINGEYQEKGEIVEFSTDKKIYYDAPAVNFKIKFSNTGNIHLQPIGEIKIYNFFNKEKETIYINHQTEYGNVLPQSERAWDFSWRGKRSLMDMGRYKAILFLSYGEQGQVTESQTINFWVVYAKEMAIFFGSLIIFIFLVTMLIRRYIKKAVRQAQTTAGVVTPAEVISHKISVIPETNGNGEIKAQVRAKPEMVKIKRKRDWSDTGKISLAIITALIIVLLGVGFLYYKGYIKIIDFRKDTGQDEETAPGLEVNQSIIENEKNEPIGGEAILPTDETDTSGNVTATGTPEVLNSQTQTQEATSTAQVKAEPAEEQPEAKAEQAIIKIFNGSGRTGVAKQAEAKVITAGYKVNSVGNADNYNYINTVVQYKTGSKTTADKIAKLFSGQVEMEEIEKGESDIIIIIGSNFK